jgi:hypothetical protein
MSPSVIRTRAACARPAPQAHYPAPSPAGALPPLPRRCESSDWSTGNHKCTRRVPRVTQQTSNLTPCSLATATTLSPRLATAINRQAHLAFLCSQAIRNRSEGTPHCSAPHPSCHLHESHVQAQQAHHPAPSPAVANHLLRFPSGRPFAPVSRALPTDRFSPFPSVICTRAACRRSRRTIPRLHPQSLSTRPASLLAGHSHPFRGHYPLVASSPFVKRRGRTGRAAGWSAGYLPVGRRLRARPFSGGAALYLASHGHARAG